MGDKFTVADAYLFTIINWTDFHAIDLTPWLNLESSMDRVAARPTFARAHVGGTMPHRWYSDQNMSDCGSAGRSFEAARRSGLDRLSSKRTKRPNSAIPGGRGDATCENYPS
jgi:hypothetical protein